MSVLNAIFQGIIQGLTEFLPVSSSGHLALFQYFTGQGGEEGAFFSVLLHAGTLIAICIAFWQTILRLIIEVFDMIWDLIRFKFTLKNASEYRHMVLMFILATLPLFIFVIFKDFIQGLASDNNILVEGICFLFTSTLLFIACRCKNGRKTAANMTSKDALAIGIMQGVALLPGVSRSGSTISTALVTGMKKQSAVEFSFILGIPAVLGAVILEMKDAFAGPIEISTAAIIAGFITSIIFGLIAIKTVNWLLKNNKFKYFAWYTLVLGIIVTIMGIEEIVTGGAVRNIIMEKIGAIALIGIEIM